MKHKGLWRGLTFVSAMLLSTGITAGLTLEHFAGTIDQHLGTMSSKIVSTDDGTLWETYKPPKEVMTDGKVDSEKLISRFIEFGRRQASGGAVLLKNENNVLPLSGGSKVTLLGMRSHMTIQGASMGMPIEGPVVSLEDALNKDVTKTNFRDVHNSASTTGGGYSGGVATPTEYKDLSDYNFADVGGEGAGFELNPETIKAYHSLENTMGVTRKGPRQTSKFDPAEPSLAQLTEANANFKTSYANYKDAAIVVVGRPSGESTDYLPGGVKEGLGVTEPLQLTTNEKEIIAEAKANFDKVVVLINTSSQMEIGDLANDKDIDSILWIGQPGNYGTLGIADILSGKVSPSGGLSDIYATSNLSAPAMKNMGDFRYSNYNDVTRKGGEKGNGSKYTIEAESIYTGYKYYETRYDDVVYKRGNASSDAGTTQGESNWDYTKEVTYGFGYGLNYGKGFSQEFVGEPVIEHKSHSFTMTFKVKVTNLDDKISGMSNVQLYGQAPYIANGVDKSAIQLLAYDKTKTLKPGESETLEIEVDLQNLASYDMNHDNGDGTKGTYILDEGDYYFSIGNGAHDALNNVLAAQGKSKGDGMDYDGIKTKAYKYNYDFAGDGTTDDITFSLSKTNVKVSNHLEYSDWNYYEKNKVTELSRSDWKNTYPITYSDMKAPDSLLKDLNGQYYTISTSDDTSNIIWGSKETNLKFADMKLAPYTDTRWDDLLNQMTMEEAMGVIACGGNQFRAIESIGFLAGSYSENSGNGVALQILNSKVTDAPWAIDAENDKNKEYEFEVFCCGPMIASSFDPDLQYELGLNVGLQACIVGMPILWGPGLNTHRTAYNGRNGDYYSEDPVLCGNVAMEFSIAALKYGLIAAPKHFAFNDQETNRAGLAPFMTEQRARECELRAFQIAIEATKYDKIEGKDMSMLGLMTSFSKIGGVECTASRGLLTDICRNEWGFHGYAVSDIIDDFDIFTAVANAGLTGYDVRVGYTDSGFDKYKSMADDVAVSADLYKNDANIQNQLKMAAKNVLYAFSQSNYMNAINSTSHTEWQMTWWRGAYYAWIGVSAAALAAFIVLYVLASRNKETA